MNEVKLVVNCQNILGEGILWNEEEKCLYWTDIEGNTFFRLEPGSGNLKTYKMPEKLCSFAFRRNSGFLMAFASGIALFDLSTEEIDWINRIRDDNSGIRLNDGRCDHAGRFIVGEFDPEEKARGLAYSIEPDGSHRELFGGLNSANSTCFSPDGSILYYSCAVAGEIWAFDYDQTSGNISNKRLFYDFSDQPGLPDGSVIDAEGFLWNAQWAGGRIVRFSPRGDINQIINFPVPNTTCLCFGGKDLNIIYVTTARMTLSPEMIDKYSSSGGLFAVKVGVSGMVESRFFG